MSNVFGCLACLAAAIELLDEATVRRMLADSSVQYADIVWLPLPIGSPFHIIKSESSNQIFGKYSLMFCIAAENLQVGVNRGSHPTAIETLEAGRKPNSCAISVVLIAMLFSTPDFNALQIMLESGRFDLREPLVFHQCYNFKNWQFIAVSTLGISSNRQSQLHRIRIPFISDSFAARHFSGVFRRCLYRVSLDQQR